MFDSKNKLKNIQVLLNNLSWSWLSRGISILVFLIITPLIINEIGREEYGIWVTFSQILVFLSIADLGISSSLGRNIAKNRAEKNYEKNNEIIFVSVSTLLLISLSLFVLGSIYAKEVVTLFKLDNVNFSNLIFIYILVLFNLLVVLPLRTGRSFVIADAKFYKIDLANTIHKIFILLLIVLILKFGKLNLINLTIIFTFLNIILEVYFFIILLKKFSLPKKIYFSDSIKDLLDYSIASLVKSVFGSLRTYGCILLSSIYFGFAASPLIALPIFLSTILSKLFGTFATSFFPFAVKIKYSQKSKYKNYNYDFFQLGKYSCRYIMSVSSVICIFLYLILEKLLIFWLNKNEKFSFDEISLMQSITICLFFSKLASVSLASFRAMFRSTNYHWQTALILTITTFLMFFIIFIKQDDISLFYLSMFITINILITDYFFVLYLIFKNFKKEFFDYLISTHTYPILIVIFNLVFFKQLINYLDLNIFVNFMFFIILYFIVNSFLFFKFCILKNHFDLLKKLFLKNFSKYLIFKKYRNYK